MKGSTIAGIGALICLVLVLLLLLLSPTGEGFEYIGIPALLILGGVSAWFWHKGTYGTAEERQWVENVF